MTEPTQAQIETDPLIKCAAEFLRIKQHHGHSDITCLYIAALLDAIDDLRKTAAAAQVGGPQHSVDFLEGIAEGKAATIERCKQVVSGFAGTYGILAALDKLKDE